MKNKLQQVMKGQIGQAGIVIIVGLAMFLVGIICLLIWGINMENNGGWFFPGLLLTGGGVVLLILGTRSGG
jgi:uncharacterized membrane protein YiaA